MREILFRGKTVDTNEWIEGYFLQLHRSERAFIVPKQFVQRGTLRMSGETPPKIIPIEVFPETVGQYTGLTDTNGKKIFEGDILRIVGCYFDVIYHNGGFVWQDLRLNKFVNYADSNSNIEQFSFVEVIDNIHDNLKLLKGGRE